MAKIQKQTGRVSDAIIEELFSKLDNPMELLSSGGLMGELKKKLLERALQGELTNHLGYQKSEQTQSDNARNGSSKKTVITGECQSIQIDTPRDRNSTFTPQILPKHSKRFEGFDKQIVALYSRGMSVRDIKAQLKEIYQVEVSEGLISDVTDAVYDEVKVWQNRPLDKCYPIVFLDGICVKIAEDKKVRNKSVYLALGVNMDGRKELLGMWIGQTESASFWLGILNELKNRGVEDIMIACTDGLNGFDSTIKDIFPKCSHQTCIVHMIRNSSKYVPWKDRKAVCADLKRIYESASVSDAEEGLKNLKGKWDKKYPSVSAIWERKWESVITMFSYSANIRRAIYTTNAIESCNRSLHKVLKTKGHFTSDESVMKLMYLAMRNISQKWTMPLRNWAVCLNQFEIMYNNK